VIQNGQFLLSFDPVGPRDQFFSVNFDKAPPELFPGRKYVLKSSGSAGGDGSTPFRVTFCYWLGTITMSDEDNPRRFCKGDTLKAPGTADEECTIIANNVAGVGQSDSGKFKIKLNEPPDKEAKGCIAARVSNWGTVS